MRYKICKNYERIIPCFSSAIMENMGDKRLCKFKLNESDEKIKLDINCRPHRNVK